METTSRHAHDDLDVKHPFKQINKQTNKRTNKQTDSKPKIIDNTIQHSTFVLKYASFESKIVSSFNECWLGQHAYDDKDTPSISSERQRSPLSNL